jgi:hypothetical protein
VEEIVEASFWGAALPWLTFVGGAVLGAVAGFWYTIWAKRPRLQLGGASHNGLHAPWRSTLGIRLAPARMGFRIGETRIFGRRVMRERFVGIQTTRDEARGCSAWIYRKGDKSQLAGLRWIEGGIIPNNGGMPPTIGPDDEATLALFGSGDSRVGPFYLLVDGPYQDNPPGYQLKLGDRPFEESERFVVVVNQQYGPRAKIKIRMTKQLDGTWEMRAAMRWRHTKPID